MVSNRDPLVIEAAQRLYDRYSESGLPFCEDRDFLLSWAEWYAGMKSEQAERDALERAAEEELKAATGTLAEAIKDLRRAAFHDAADFLERKTMPETVEIFEQAIRELKP